MLEANTAPVSTSAFPHYFMLFHVNISNCIANEYKEMTKYHQ